MKSPPVWAIIIAHACNNWGSYMILTSLPKYMAEVLKFDIKTVSLVKIHLNFTTFCFTITHYLCTYSGKNEWALFLGSFIMPVILCIMKSCSAIMTICIIPFRLLFIHSYHQCIELHFDEIVFCLILYLKDLFRRTSLIY